MYINRFQLQYFFLFLPPSARASNARLVAVTKQKPSDGVGRILTSLAPVLH